MSTYLSGPASSMRGFSISGFATAEVEEAAAAVTANSGNCWRKFASSASAGFCELRLRTCQLFVFFKTLTKAAFALSASQMSNTRAEREGLPLTKHDEASCLSCRRAAASVSQQARVVVRRALTLG